MTGPEEKIDVPANGLRAWLQATGGIVAVLLLTPGILVGLAIGRDADGRMTISGSVVGTIVVCVLSAVAFVVGPRVSAYLAAKRRERIREHLADPVPDTRP